MKAIKKISGVVLALVMVLCMSISSFAATPVETVETEAAKVVTVEFVYEKVAGIYGTFTYSNPDLFSNVEFDIEGFDKDDEGLYNPNNGALAYYKADAVDCTITLTLTIAEDAKPGDKCVITFEYEATEDGVLPPDYAPEKDAVTVIIPDKEEPPVTDELDYTELLKQIDRAQQDYIKAGKESEYTSESWAKMLEELDKALAALYNCETQEEIDAYTAALKAAIDGLVPVEDKPVDPDQPVDPDEPDEPVKTGDAFLFSGIVLVAAAAAVGFIVRKRKTAVR